MFPGPNWTRWHKSRCCSTFYTCAPLSFCKSCLHSWNFLNSQIIFHQPCAGRWLPCFSLGLCQLYGEKNTTKTFNIQSASSIMGCLRMPLMLHLFYYLFPQILVVKHLSTCLHDPQLTSETSLPGVFPASPVFPRTPPDSRCLLGFPRGASITSAVCLVSFLFMCAIVFSCC